MSHFTVLVIGEDVEEQLAKYNENLEIEFQDETAEWQNDYETKTCHMKKLPDGRVVFPWDPEFSSKIPFEKPVFPEGATDVEVPQKERYATFEEYVTEWHGHDLSTPCGYWRNPDAKWDWYMVGGRWTGYFKLKPGEVGEIGEPGVMTSFCDDEDRADIARKGDIDFDGMVAEHLEEKQLQYQNFHEMVKGRAIPLWRDVLSMCEYRGGTVDDARKIYNNNEVIVDLREAGVFWLEDSFIEKMLLPLKEYLKKESKQALSTFAVVKDGVWYERGEMGWFATVANEKDADTWLEEWYNLVMSMPDDTLLTVVDCHI